MEAEEAANYDLTVDISATAIDHQYYIEPFAQINPLFKPKLVRQSYIFFILELRTGVTQLALKNIQNSLLQSCEEIMNQELKGISFIINGEHHPVKNLTFNAVKEMIMTILTVTQNDDYFITLQKTRHSIQSVAQKLNQTKISLIFFMSYVEIDHSLGVKKRSYIDLLNEHSEKCTQEVQRLSKTIRAFTDECKTYIISLDKNGEQSQDYSLADTQLMNQIIMLVGNYGSILKRNQSLGQLNQSFKEITTLLMHQLYSIKLTLPLTCPTKIVESYGICLYCHDCLSFHAQGLFVHKHLLDMQKIFNKQEIIVKDFDNLQQKVGEMTLKTTFKMIQVSEEKLLLLRLQMYNKEVSGINHRLSTEIVSYKRKFQLNKSFLVMNINQALLAQLKEKIDHIYNLSKTLYNEIFQNGQNYNRHNLYECYSSLKSNIDLVQQVLMAVFKKKLGGSEIGLLSQAISFSTIRNSLKNKLVRRINANPNLLEQVYSNIKSIVDGGTIDYLTLQASSQDLRYNVGNCIISDYNFVKAMKQYDALGVAFQIQRPESAIADPGRIRIRQISPFLMRTSKFFEKFMYKIDYNPQVISRTFLPCYQCIYNNCTFQITGKCKYFYLQEKTQILKYGKTIQKVDNIEWNKDVSQNNFIKNGQIRQFQYDATLEIDYLRDVGGLEKQNYSEKWDYSGRVEGKSTTLGFMPLYLTSDHWRIAKNLMKPCMGWTATGEPLGYLFSQYQTIPFMLLSSLIKTVKQKEYHILQQQKQVPKCTSQRQLNTLQTKINFLKKKHMKLTTILKSVQETCLNIMKELSTEKYDQKLIEKVYNNFRNYVSPINRTVDVISNNSCFISQIYCFFKYELAPKPKEELFHEFFIRLVEEQLRRQTDGWNEQETQDLFIDKLLNVSAAQIKNIGFSIVGGQEYYSNFMEALKGNQVQASFVELKKQELQLMLKKQGKFNDNQRLLLIQYKRLYENRVLWLWYVRFLLYNQLQRKSIHKWKCVNMSNSYMLFSMIIQNKKQRKNYKRREAILDQNYVDPFDYNQAKQYLQREFVMLKSKKEAETLKNINQQMYLRAATIFCQTGSLEQAAGTLLNISMNTSTVANYYYELMTGTAVMLDEKLAMLLRGQYLGVRLFAGWKMSKQRTHRLRNTYPIEFQRHQYKF